MIYHKERLSGVDPRLVSILDAVQLDFIVLVGLRDDVQQEQAFVSGLSKVHYPESKHNINPNAGRDHSEATDLCPYPAPEAGQWESKDTIARHYILMGAVKQAALTLGIPIRQGGDWDGDGMTNDQPFNDLGHVELLPPLSFR